MKMLCLVIGLLFLFSCVQEKASPWMQPLSSDLTGIDFSNTLVSTPSFSILEYLYFYNGAGVAAGDINNDGLDDIFFASNQGLDQLYINKGQLKFEKAENMFDQSALTGWSTGVTMIDVNCDGWLDIYVCRLGDYKDINDHNRLFINQKGNLFIESSKEYGLDFSGFSTHATFFDYDRDGDLDCYLVNHSVKSPEQFRPSEIREEVDDLAGDRLLRCDGDQYQDISHEAGIYSSQVGFGLDVTVGDFNNDHWPDLYVSNDFHEQDYLYINDKNGRFEEVVESTTGHVSNFTMGCYAADLNNDLQDDIFSLDMKPFTERVHKESGGWENLQIYNYKRSFGYHHQSMHNALQMNLGNAGHELFFSEQASLLGVEASDWSWSPIIGDFNQDGYKDIYVTNGIERRPNDKDFIDYTFNELAKDKLSQIENMPEGKVENILYLFDPTTGKYQANFDQTKTCSTGAAMADFDRDGDLDLVINNINQDAMLIENQLVKQNKSITLRLNEGACNKFGIGCTAILYQGKIAQKVSIQSSQGFQSSSSPFIHFALHNSDIDSTKIIWSDGSYQWANINREIGIQLITKKEQGQLTDLNTSKPSNIRTVQNFVDEEKNFVLNNNDKWFLFHEDSKAPSFHRIEDELWLLDRKQKTLGHILEEEFVPNNQAQYDLPTQMQNVLDGLDILAYQSGDMDGDGDDDYVVLASEQLFLFEKVESDYRQNTVLEKTDVKTLKVEDLDGDGDLEILITGPWCPITILTYEGSVWNQTEIPNSHGLWFVLEVVDLNKDGTMDIVAGNFGLNHSIQVSEKNPMRSYTLDFDKNGAEESFVSYFKNGKEHPYVNQELFVAQLPMAKKKFLKSSTFAQANVSDLFSAEAIDKSNKKYVEELASCYFLQEGSNWSKHILPLSLQASSIHAIEALGDGSLVFGGNLFDVDPNWGRQDASSLSVYKFEDGIWTNGSNKYLQGKVHGELRDIALFNNKLFSIVKGDSIKIVDLNKSIQ